MRPCPLCGNKSFLNYVYKTYATCTKCDHTYQPEPFKKVWMNPNTGDCNGFEGATMNEQEKSVNMYLAAWLTKRTKPKTTLDVGCGYPYLAYCFKTLGANATAVDGAFADGIINNDLDVNASAHDWESKQAYDGDNVDLVTMIHSFEHFQDPIAAMVKAKNVLTDEGVLYIRSPSKDVSGIERDHTEGHAKIHPNIFGTESMKYAAEKAGLYLIWMEHSNGYGQTSWIFKKRPPTVSLCMIVKNEEERIAKCLDSVRDYCDDMFIVDTGSTDKTIEVAEAAGAKVFRSDHFDEETKKGGFHFAKARNESLSKATGDWIFWMDADDLFDGPPDLRLNPELDAYNVWISYGKMRFHHCRIFRNDWGVHFKGAIHEYAVIDNLRVGKLPNATVVHETGDKPGRVERNISILEQELKDEPDNKRTMFYLGNSYREAGKTAQAINIYSMYIDAGGNFPDELYLAQYYLGMCFYQARRYDLAIKESLKAIALNDSWAEAYCCVGESYWFKKDYKKAISYLNIALSLDLPQTGMFVRRELYESVPRWWLSRCYESMGDMGQARKYAKGDRKREQQLGARVFVIEVCRPGALGDVLCTTPAVKQLRVKHPGAHIRYVTHPSSKAILDCNPDIDEVFTTDKSQSDKHADVRVIFNYPMHEGYPETALKKHIAEHFADCASVKLPDDWRNVLNLTPDGGIKLEHKKPVVAFHVKTGWSKYKEWPLDRWKELIAMFPDHQFLQLGAEGEEAVEGAQSLCGRLTLRESFSVLSQAVLFIGLDSLFQHAANALDVPAVVMFGSTAPDGSGYSGHTNLWSNHECSPCIVGNSLIQTNKGMLPIMELVDNHDEVSVLTSDGTYHDIKDVWCSGVKETIKIETSNGLSIQCTPEHELLVIKNKPYHKSNKIITKVPASEVGYDDWLVTQPAIQNQYDKSCADLPDGLFLDSWNEDLGYVMGYTIGDGSFYKWEDIKCLIVKAWGEHDMPCLHHVKKIVDGWFGCNNNVQFRVKTQAPPGQDAEIEYPEWSCSWRRESLTRLMTVLGFTKDKPLKCPESIFKAPLKSVAGFLAGLYDADGSIEVSKKLDKRNDKAYNNVRINLSSKHESLLKGTQLLLIRLGIHSTICRAKRTLPDRVTSYYYRLDISESCSISLFKKHINLKHFKKLNTLKTIKDFDRTRYPIVKIKNMSNSIVDKVYDMSVEGQHDFSANGILISNCYRENNAIAVHKKPACPYEHKCMIDYMSVEKVAGAVAEKLGVIISSSVEV